MDFSLSERQEMLRKAARGFMDTKCPRPVVRDILKDEKGYYPELWQQMADLGWTGLIFPKEYGGIGGSFLDLAVLLEEMGRGRFPSPFFSTVVLAGFTILKGGNADQKRELLSQIASGKGIFTLALTEIEACYLPSAISLKATCKGSDYVVSGTKLFVPDAHVADYIICVARTGEGTVPEEGITLFLVDAKSPGISHIQLKTIGDDRQSEVVFDSVKVPSKNILGELGKGYRVIEDVLQKATIAKCAEMVGGAQKVLEMTVEYAKERVQFGQAIGSFQAVQHHCANMVIDVDSSRFVTYKAAWMLSEGLPCRGEVSMAKAWVSEAYRRVAELGHQVIGGVSVIIDHDMPLYSKGAKMAELVFGDADFHREMVARQLNI